MRARKKNRTRYKIRWTRVLLVVIVLSIVIACSAGAAYYAANKFWETPIAADNSLSLSDNSTSAVLTNKINVLLLGLDDGDFDTPNSPSRSDAMLVASLDPDKTTVNLLSIPRDTRVNIPGYKGLDKINNAYFLGNSALAIRTVENFLNIPIQDYVTINWQGFIKVVDILDGVDLYVERDMAYEDPYADLKIDLHKGYQHLNGQKAGEYVRFRHDELGDIGRVQRQQLFLKALSKQFLQFSTLVKIPLLVKAIDQNVATNMSGYTFLKAANTLRIARSGTMTTEMLPGNFATIHNISYWEPDKEQVKQVVERMFNSHESTISQN